MRRGLAFAAVVGAAALAAGLLTATPAYAGTCVASDPCDTTVTFDVTAGALQITVPDTVDLANDGAPGGFAYGQLGAITVDDLRASATPSWVATVSSTAFITGAGTDPGTSIPASDIYYCSGDATATTGSGTFVPGQASPCDPPPPADGTALDTPATAFSHTVLPADTGNNSATWNPLLTVAVPLSAVAGQFTGTITHSVA
ncbi:hypothetical protein [Micromonospora humida]|uniref:Uncharacterized protein n=1 Tax=Micromonospora humida TaxID=2809018 RepID=A0ABS2J352_9ACTN|nr:hypothetical protein [Micromonospora humida]MBM7079844.1 hypothetical protein [Micromonospora humida]